MRGDKAEDARLSAGPSPAQSVKSKNGKAVIQALNDSEADGAQSTSGILSGKKNASIAKKIALAKEWSSEIDPSGWLVSEVKYCLLGGNVSNAPSVRNHRSRRSLYP